MESFVYVAGAVLLILMSFILSSRPRRKLPPGPYPLPIIGNMLQLDRKIHYSFTKLSKQYGPLMSIHLGSLYSVVVSSPEMAKEILQKHGQVFSGRIMLQALQVCDHDKLSIGFMPASNIWRELRKICKEHLFSHKSLEASNGLRQWKLQQLLDYVQRCCDSGRAVNIREAAFTTTLNLMSTTLFSIEATEFDSEVTREFKEIMEGVSNIALASNLGDFFPILKPFDLQGIKRKAEGCLGKLRDKVEGYLNQRLEWRKANPDAPKKTDFLETLVDIMEATDSGHFTTDHLIHLLMDLFAGAADSTSITTEWIMTELMINPEKLAKVKEELKSVVGDKKKVVEESQMARLPYLQAVVKEVLRYHPPGPLLLPRKAESDQQLNGGYFIPKGTQIFINAWAIGRDPTIWKNPDSFEPERFLDKNIDLIGGQDYEFIPFGSGRRICPGAPLANRMLHMTTATLIHNFDWKLEDAAADHRAEQNGMPHCRAAPLTILPIN
ncbi:hypothetical protein C2S53_017182 [Perilla frutescens var. hirtella]|uniref:Cytochrome P450 n=1 Tax=Perilla frutescens var. hirtella TaxID=608512 RepID=A0AAD4JKN8_PERFH|nr:hypothetical protein C2S53_017182 [Perilla frutescens var. hirtella]